MNWKEFLKPDWRKIVITIFLYISDYFAVPIPYHSIQVLTKSAIVLWLSIAIMVFYDLFLSYLISCFIVWFYDKMKKRKKKRIR